MLKEICVSYFAYVVACMSIILLFPLAGSAASNTIINQVGDDIEINCGRIGSGAYPIPIVFKWNCDGNIQNSSILGGNWNVPLLDSTLIPVDAHRFKWKTISGREIIIRDDSQDSGVIVESEGDIFKVLDMVNQWRYFYRNGRLFQISDPFKKNVVFLRSPEEMTINVDGQIALQLKSESQDKKKLIVAGVEYLFSKTSLSKWSFVNGVPIVQDILNSFSCVTVDGMPIFSVEENFKDKNHLVRSVQAGGCKFFYFFDNLGWHSGDDNAEKKNLMAFQNVNGTSVAKDSEGTIYEQNVFQGRGLLSGKIRFERIVFPKSKQTLTRKFRYDQNGNLLGFKDY